MSFQTDASFDAAAAARRVAEQNAEKDPITLALIAHFAAAGLKPSDALDAAKADTRLSDDERQAVLEAVPTHFQLVKDGPRRWRAIVSGQAHKIGHGATAAEAIEAYVLGNRNISAQDAAAHRFAALPESTQQEIRDRDAAVGQTETVEAARERAAAEREASQPARPSIFEATEEKEAPAATPEIPETPEQV